MAQVLLRCRKENVSGYCDEEEKDEKEKRSGSVYDSEISESKVQSPRDEYKTNTLQADVRQGQQGSGVEIEEVVGIVWRDVF